MKHPAISLFLFLGMGLIQGVLQAATFTWNGAGPGNQVSIPANWVNGSAPSNTGLDDLVFGDSTKNFPEFDASLSIRNLTFSASSTYYFLDATGGTNSILTVTGDITTTAGSSPFLVFSVPLALSAGAHAVTTDGGDLYIWGGLSGSGDLTKTGNRLLDISGNDNVNANYTGNVTLAGPGQLYVGGDHALGIGTVTLNGGTLAVSGYDTDRAVTLGNNFIFGSSFTIGDSLSSDRGENLTSHLTLTGDVDSPNGSTISVEKTTTLTLSGNVTGAGTGLNFTGEGFTRLTGTNTYSGGTTVQSGVVILDNSIPTNGSLLSLGNGYLGSGVTSNLQAGFLDHFDKANTTGLIGFDENVFNPVVFSGPIDLTSFSSSARLGTATSATLTGHITPQGSVFQFGGRGVLTLASTLDGSASLSVSDGLLLYLSAANRFTGDIEANLGGVIFNHTGALPASATLVALAGGYIGATETAALDTSSFLAAFDGANTTGVVGFDSADVANPRTVSDAIDLSGFSQDAFIGTATKVTLAGAITPSGSSYNFTGFRDGQLTVDSTLSGSYSAIIGLVPGDIASVAPGGGTYSPSVTLNGNNTYTGVTFLQSGTLVLGHANALGSGLLKTGDSRFSPLTLSTTGTMSVANNILLSDDNGTFILRGDFDYTLSGSISGSVGQILKLGPSALTFSGDNSGLSAGISVGEGTAIFASDTAAGTGPLNLLNDDNGHHGIVYFTSSAPVMGSLQGDSNTYLNLDMGTGNQLTINQSSDESFHGTIQGTGGLIKDGSGTLELTSPNTYDGSTTILAGNLRAGNNSALGNGGVTLNGGQLTVASGVSLSNALDFGPNGGTLGGNGLINQAATIGTNIVVSPGESVGSLSFGADLTFAPGGTYNFEVQAATGTAGVGYDTITLDDSLVFTSTFGSPFNLNLLSLGANGSAGLVADFNSANAYSWTIVTANSGIVGFDASTVVINPVGFSNSLSGGTFSLVQDGNELKLLFSPVPEPSTWLLMAGGVGALAAGFRRRSVGRR